MKGNRIARILKISLFGALGITLFGFLVMSLWNWLVPALLGGTTITFWQALGVLLLSRILFGHLGGPGPRMHWRHRMRERFQRMTPEEREAFLEGLKA